MPEPNSLLGFHSMFIKDTHCNAFNCLPPPSKTTSSSSLTNAMLVAAVFMCSPIRAHRHSIFALACHICTFSVSAIHQLMRTARIKIVSKQGNEEKQKQQHPSRSDPPSFIYIRIYIYFNVTIHEPRHWYNECVRGGSRVRTLVSFRLLLLLLLHLRPLSLPLHNRDFILLIFHVRFFCSFRYWCRVAVLVRPICARVYSKLPFFRGILDFHGA